MLDREITQPHFCDERGYRLAPWELDKPLWKFSSGCQLNLDITYDNVEEAKSFWSKLYERGSFLRSTL